MDNDKDYPVVSIHDFKTNLSRYLRVLRRKEAKGIVVRRYQKPLAMLIALSPPPKS